MPCSDVSETGRLVMNAMATTRTQKVGRCRRDSEPEELEDRDPIDCELFLTHSEPISVWVAIGEGEVIRRSGRL